MIRPHNNKKWVAINRNLTILIPDADEIDTIIKSYLGPTHIDFLGSDNRYIWLFKTMYYCMDEIEQGK